MREKTTVQHSHEMSFREELGKCLSTKVKSYNLPRVCEELGLASGTSDEAHLSKASYVRRRLESYSENDLIALSSRVLDLFEDFRLSELLRMAQAGWQQRITELTRRDMLAELIRRGSFAGQLEKIDFLQRLWPLDMLPSSNMRFDTLFKDLFQHTVRNDDYTDEDLFTQVDLPGCSDEQFARFVELLVHPLVRKDKEQSVYVEFINNFLRRDGYELVACDELSGYPIYAIQQITSGVEGHPKNLIFASIGPKPEIVIRDAINNTIP